MRQLETEVEEAARRQACADLEAARSLEAARAELAAAQREAEVLRAGKGAEKDSALAALKVCAPHPSCTSTVQPVSSSPAEDNYHGCAQIPPCQGTMSTQCAPQ